MSAGERQRPAVCPSCGAVLDGATHAKGDTRLRPKDGDVSVCIYCASVLVFDAGAPRAPTADELAVLMADELVREVVTAVRAAGVDYRGRN